MLHFIFDYTYRSHEAMPSTLSLFMSSGYRIKSNDQRDKTKKPADLWKQGDEGDEQIKT